MKILFIPLDERPCNYAYPVSLLEGVDEISLILPEKSILSHKKEPACLTLLWEFLEKELPDCDAAILSLDMLIYGGLLPSRLHQEPLSVLLERVNRLYQLHIRYKHVKLYAFDCIMRVPAYNSNDEEPDYYGAYGRKIFELSEMEHKKTIDLLSEEELCDMKRLKATVPQDYLDDYFTRRDKNKKVTSHIIRLIQQGLFEQFIIPQDDSAVYGVQVLEQQEHIKACRELHLQTKVYVYPGADEAGLTLLSKAIIDYKKMVPAVYIRYGSLTGRFVVPAFEDRPYEETIKWQLLSAGLTIVDSGSDADIILMVNVPGQKQYSAKEQANNNRENSSMRNLLELVRSAKHYLSGGKTVAVADVAYANGGDLELLQLLRLENIQDKISSYAGWNTDANTLGTAVCFAVVSYFYGVNKDFLLYRYMEDCGYQSLIRQRLIEEYDCTLEFGRQESALQNICFTEYDHFISAYLCPALASECRLESVSFPWNRLFEIDLQLGGFCR